jgi:predicted nucleotidyltransferase component of viral defense system
LYRGSSQTRNRIRIDAAKRTGTLEAPEWRLISSEYPETRERFHVLVMSEEEMLVEKAIALMERGKGRDLYDIWFMLEKGVPVNEELYLRKGGQEFQPRQLVSREKYERDLKRLTRRIIPYSQVKRDVERGLSVLKH